MSSRVNEPQSVVVEREFAYSPEKVWTALTQSELIEEWLMAADFKPVVGHRFNFTADWGAVECEVLEVAEYTRLSYTWGNNDLDTVVTWSLTPTANRTCLRMEQVGFKQGQPRYYKGAKAGWPRFMASLEQLLDQID